MVEEIAIIMNMIRMRRKRGRSCDTAGSFWADLP
jgi:hypothetical protein